MREMRDSGVEWIGEIPKDWNCCKQKYRFTLINGRAFKDNEFEEDGTYRILRVGNLFSNPVWYSSSLELEPDKYCEKGDLIYAWSMSYGPYIWNEEKVIYHYHIWKTKLVSDMDKMFSYYYLQALTESIKSQTHETTMGFVTMGIMNNSYIAYPRNIKEQKKISNYLDIKCSKIDEIIEKQQAIIEKLKEYKLSTITEVVTSGLNQKREMKDSHVLSIGRIPTNWDVTKLYYLFGNGDDGLKIGPFGSAIKGKTLESGLYKIYNQAHLINNDFSLNRHYVSEDTFNDLKAYEVKPGDVLFSMMGTIGKCQIMPKGYPKGIMDSHLLKARLNEKVIPEFFIYAYDKDFSNQVIQQLLYTSNGTIMNGLNSTILKNVYIALPPLEEQEEIVEFLNKFTKNIDDRIGVKTKIVEKLQEYKKSLIYEVVTGKKEV